MPGRNRIRKSVDRLHVFGTRSAFSKDGREKFSLQRRDEAAKDVNDALPPPK
jgi:hypothetical protein